MTPTQSCQNWPLYQHYLQIGLKTLTCHISFGVICMNPTHVTMTKASESHFDSTNSLKKIIVNQINYKAKNSRIRVGNFPIDHHFNAISWRFLTLQSNLQFRSWPICSHVIFNLVDSRDVRLPLKFQWRLHLIKQNELTCGLRCLLYANVMLGNLQPKLTPVKRKIEPDR